MKKVNNVIEKWAKAIVPVLAAIIALLIFVNSTVELTIITINTYDIADSYQEWLQFAITGLVSIFGVYATFVLPAYLYLKLKEYWGGPVA